MNKYLCNLKLLSHMETSRSIPQKEHQSTINLRSFKAFGSLEMEALKTNDVETATHPTWQDPRGDCEGHFQHCRSMLHCSEVTMVHDLLWGMLLKECCLAFILHILRLKTKDWQTPTLIYFVSVPFVGVVCDPVRATWIRRYRCCPRQGMMLLRYCLNVWQIFK